MCASLLVTVMVKADGSFDIWIFIAQIHNKYCEKVFFFFCFGVFVCSLCLNFFFILRQDIFYLNPGCSFGTEVTLQSR